MTCVVGDGWRGSLLRSGRGWVYIRCAGSGDRRGEQRNCGPGWPRYRGKSIGGRAGDAEGQE